MSDFSLDDAVSGQGNAGNLQSQGQGQQQNYNPWGGQNPGQPYPGFTGPGQPYQGFPGPGQGQYPGNPGQDQQYPGFQGPGQGQQYPQFPPGGAQFPGYAGFAGPGQPFPGAPGQGPGQSFPGAPGQGPGQSFPGAPIPGQGPTAPSAPSGPKKVPFEITLPSGLTNGMMLTVTGKMTGKRFNIDYKEGPNIPFHFNPRVDEKPYSVVRNTMMNGEWGQEEREIPKFPFQLGQPFVIKILFDQNCYRVMVNNENFCQYTHRMKNFAAIKLIRIDGNLDISDATLTTV